MKKAISLILAAALVLSLAFVFSSCSNKNYKGTWKGSKNGFKFEVKIKSDNTGTMTVNGESQGEGTDTVSFKIEDGTLIMDTGDMGLSVDEYRHKLTKKGDKLTIESPEGLDENDLDYNFYGWIFPLELTKKK